MSEALLEWSWICIKIMMNTLTPLSRGPGPLHPQCFPICKYMYLEVLKSRTCSCAYLAGHKLTSTVKTPIKGW